MILILFILLSLTLFFVRINSMEEKFIGFSGFKVIETYWSNLWSYQRMVCIVSQIVPHAMKHWWIPRGPPGTWFPGVPESFFFMYSGGSRISPRWGRQLSRGAPTYDFAINFQKLHELERICEPQRKGRVQILLCRSSH